MLKISSRARSSSIFQLFLSHVVFTYLFSLRYFPSRQKKKEETFLFLEARWVICREGIMHGYCYSRLGWMFWTCWPGRYFGRARRSWFEVRVTNWRVRRNKLENSSWHLRIVREIQWRDFAVEPKLIKSCCVFSCPTDGINYSQHTFSCLWNQNNNWDSSILSLIELLSTECLWWKFALNRNLNRNEP